MSRSVRQNANDLICHGKLGQLGHALANYRDCYGCLPPAYLTNEKDQRLHSWRVLLLPFLEAKDVYMHYDWLEPWDGPANLNSVKKMNAQPGGQPYRCPGDRANKGDITNYVAIVGEKTLWPGSFPYSERPPAFSMLLVELPESHIHWMEPGDITVNQLKLLPSLIDSECPHNRHVNYLAAGGKVWRINGDVTLNLLQPLDLSAVVQTSEPSQVKHESMKKLVTRLVMRLNDQDPVIRHGAVLLLGQLEDDANTVTNALRAALRDDDSWVRAAVKYSLRKLASKNNRGKN